MNTFDKYLPAGLLIGVMLIITLLFCGVFWSSNLAHDCRIAAMQTKLYDSAQINRICGR